jgi:hypothetical protein
MERLDLARLQRCIQPTSWDKGNQVLYELCKEYPRHDREDEIIAKVWLIGRSYSASIERRPKSKGSVEAEANENFYERVVGPQMVAAKIDDWLAPLEKIEKPDSDNAQKILSVHKKLTDLFFAITEHNKRSLASKYLHFHFPKLFYLYDSRAAVEISKLTNRVKIRAHVEMADPVYAQYFFRCLELVAHVEKQMGIMLGPRELDNYLLNINN